MLKRIMPTIQDTFPRAEFVAFTCPLCNAPLIAEHRAECTNCDWVAKPAPDATTPLGTFRDRAAVVLSVIPGLGHIYKGYNLIGAVFMFGIVFAILMGFEKNLLQLLPGAGQAGHDRADRRFDDFGYFLVRESLEFPEDEDFTEFRVEFVERFPDGLGIALLHRRQRRLGGVVFDFHFDIVQWDVQGIAPIPLEPGVAGIPDDAEQPGAGGFPPALIDKPKRPEAGFLNDVFGVVFIPSDPTREMIAGV
jgi:hypothetical protein